MSILSADVGNAAPGHKITHKGITYEFRLLDWALLCEWERRRYSLERQRLHECKDDIPPEVYERKRTELYEKYETHGFHFLHDEFASSPLGSVFLMALITGQSEKDCWKLMTERPEEVAGIIELVRRESFPKSAAEAKESASAEDLPKTNGSASMPPRLIATTEPS